MVGYKTKIGQSFSKSAFEYDQYATVQFSMMQKLVEGIKGNFESILDLGSGTGRLVYELSQKYPKAKVIGLDIAPGMIEFSQRKYRQAQIEFIQGDAEQLHFNKGIFDLVVSNASLQWMDIEKVFKETVHLLCPEGEFHFTTFGPRTLCELKIAGLSINQFPERQAIEEQLIQLFNNVQITSEYVNQSHKDIYAFFTHLKRVGAQNPIKIRSRGLVTPRRINNIFPANKAFNANYEIYYIKCKK